MSAIYFIRHGQASFGTDDYDRLSPLGIRQAEVLARFLDRHGIRFDAIFSGEMERQKDTAGPVCQSQKLALKVMNAFNEYDHMALILARVRRDAAAGRSIDLAREQLRRDPKAFQAYFSETVDQWMAGDYDTVAAVEPWPDFCRRVKGGIEALMATQGRGKRLAVFTSGGPISVAVKTALGLSDGKTAELSWELLNAAITHLKYSGDRLSLTGFNNTTHLLMEGDAALLTHR